MPFTGSRLRALALVIGGAEALHQARYHLAQATHASGPMHTEHAYLHAVTPLVLGLLALAAVEFLLRLARAPAGSPDPRDSFPRLVELWSGAALALLAIYAVQETLEGALAHGQVGLGRVFGAGGWVVILLAAAIGAVIALLLRGSAVALELIAMRRRRERRGERPSRLAPPFRVEREQLNVIARFLAGRGPPVSM